MTPLSAESVSKRKGCHSYGRFVIAAAIAAETITWLLFGSSLLEFYSLEDSVRVTVKSPSLLESNTIVKGWKNAPNDVGSVMIDYRNENNSSLQASNITNKDMNHIPMAGKGSNGEEVQTEPVLTLLVMLSGEFGNNIFKIIRGWGTAQLAKREFGLTTRIVFAEQRVRGRVIAKAKRTTKNLKNCFLSPSYIQNGDFGMGNHLLDAAYFEEITAIPGIEIGSTFTLSDGKSSNINDIRENLKILSNYLSENPGLVEKEKEKNRVVQNGSVVPRLMVRVDALNVYPIVNEFYDEIRETFVFDESKCCGNTLDEPPGPDETVLHLRNFATDVKKENRRARGFEELDSDRISSELLGHLEEGNKLALAGRNLKSDSQNNRTEAYEIISAIKAKNLTLRFTPGSSEMEDFCFLTRTKKELIGTSSSTYFLLAAYLAGPSLELTRAYKFLSPEVKNDDGPSKLKGFRKIGSVWTQRELQSRIMFEEYF